MSFSLADLKHWFAEHREEILQDYFTFLKFPSISTDPAYKADIHRTAAWVEGYLKKIGLKTETWPTHFHPVVFASHLADPARPTLLIYHHYDVQPVDPLELWKSPPFEPEIREGKVYARGASDNKGQCFYTLTALKAVFELAKYVNFNIKVLIEGEEECGSQGALQVLSMKQEQLKADYLLIVDTGLAARDTPAITLGLRGVIALEVVCRNSSVDLHSGLHGGVVLNPNRALIQMLAQLWDKRGQVTVPGFYDKVVSLSKDDLQSFHQSVDQGYLQKQFGIKTFQGEGDYSLWESNTLRPTLEINGIAGGYAGAGFKTVIPSQSIAKLSCRLVPEQDPEEIARLIDGYLKKLAPLGLEVSVVWDHGGKPVRSSPDTKIAQICAEAYTEVFGKSCQKILGGASVPLVADLVAACSAEVAMIGVSLDSDDIHAPNEHFGLDQFEQGFLTMGTILRRLSQ